MTDFCAKVNLGHYENSGLIDFADTQVFFPKHVSVLTLALHIFILSRVQYRIYYLRLLTQRCLSTVAHCCTLNIKERQSYLLQNKLLML